MFARRVVAKLPIVRGAQVFFGSEANSSVRSLTRLHDLPLQGLHSVLNQSRALEQRCNFGYNKTVPLGKVEAQYSYLSGKRIAVLTPRKLGESEQDMNVQSVLRLCGAEIVPLNYTALLRASKGFSGESPAEKIVSYLKEEKTADMDLLLAWQPGAAHQPLASLLSQLSVPSAVMSSSESSPLCALGLTQTILSRLPSLYAKKISFIGDGANPLVYDLAWLSKTFHFNFSIGCSPRNRPNEGVLNKNMTAGKDQVDTNDKLATHHSLEICEHPFIATNQADIVVTDTILPVITHKNTLNLPLSSSMRQYELDREMQSIAMDTVLIAHASSGLHSWTQAPLGLDDPRCLYSNQQLQENLALVSMVMYLLNKPLSS